MASFSSEHMIKEVIRDAPCCFLYFFSVLSFPFLSPKRFWYLASLLPTNSVVENIYFASHTALLIFI